MDAKVSSTGNRSISANNTDTVYSFHLALFSGSGEIHELWLPFIPEGIFRFSDRPEHRFLTILARDGKWHAATRKPAFFQNVPLEQSFMLPLRDKLLLAVDYDDNSYFLLAEQVSAKNLIYHNYSVSKNTIITIGSHPSNDICYKNPFIAPYHAELHHNNGQWSLLDRNSEYGTFVDNIRITNAPLTLGSAIYIMGLRIIIGPSFLSITDSLDQLTLNNQKLRNIQAGGYSRYYNQISCEQAEFFFNRMPRKRLEMSQSVVSVEGPPPSINNRQIPLMLRMGSSMVMGGTAALAGNFTTLISSVLFPFLSNRYTEDQRKEYERLRTTKYREYLAEKKKEIDNVCREERIFLNQKYPNMHEVMEIIRQKEHLWERRPGDNDFMQIRVGTGTQLLTTQIDYPPRRFALDSDSLEEEMYALVETPKYLDDVPIVLSLMETRVCGLIGEHQKRIEYIRQLILQICAFHSYDEVKTIFFLTKEELDSLDEIRYLPHVWDDQRSIRFIATDEAEAYRLGEYLKNQTADEGDERDIKRIMRSRPFYMIFALNKKLFESHETLKEILQYDDIQGFSVITAYNDLPKESQKIISLQHGGRNTFTTLGTDGGDDTAFSCAPCDRKEILDAVKVLSNTKLKTADQEQLLPKMVTFMDMFQTGRVEQLNALNRWEKSDPIKSLAAPVGVSADGELFYLDLHEKRQGPHGLVAGMTGSGKSEFIITYILSMAVTYHPDEVAFVLIDYKGGGLAGAFENPQTGVRLPHLVGTITNLDGASIQRSLLSIESELLRRQRIFNEVKSAVNEGTIDIYSYQKLYRAGKVDEPMPHLFIISDEFAELKQQQPEFMAKLISAARIGRSLGVHLILATQKPSGVVDDQIRSNTKFRVCLRVQERSDSMDMLKRPEAAELTDTGRFYLQVGYNEYFAQGQSAWCGAAYEPKDTVSVQRDNTLEFLDTTGQILTKVKPKERKIDSGKKQIVAIVEYLSSLADTYNIRPRQLWMPELPLVLDTSNLQPEVDAEHSMTIPLGLLDDPENQTQFPLVLDFNTCGNLLITGDSYSGKTSIAQNILYSLVNKLPPEDFQFYVLDYSSRMMKTFNPLPNCGAVLYEEDTDLMDGFFKLVNDLITQRKKLFAELQVDNFEDARKLCRLPLVIVLIDNVAGMLSSKTGENHHYKLQNYLKNSANYGVKYILTCSHTSEVSSRVRRECSERISLHMKDKYDYSEVLECPVSYIPPERPGRGLYNVDGRAIEFHASMPFAEQEDTIRLSSIKEQIDLLCLRYSTGVEARHLPVYSEQATYQDFSRQFKGGRIPLGLSKQTGKPVALPLKQFSGLSLYLGNPRGNVPIISNMLYAGQREKMDIWVVKRETTSIFENTENADRPAIPAGTRLFSGDKVSVDNFTKELSAEAALRNELIQEYCTQEGIDGTPEDVYKKIFPYLTGNTRPIMVLIENFADFCNATNIMSALILSKLFGVAQRRNIYIVACYEPDDYKRIKSRTLYYSFSGSSHILMLGGQLNRQDIYPIENTSAPDRSLPYNAGIMNYNNLLHAMVMPCGDITASTADEDEQDIFLAIS